MTGPVPPPTSCPIGWQPSALTPVFYGVREYGSAHGAPVRLRTFFPSLDGAASSAPILDGCGRYPVVLFAHGDCPGDANHFRKWVNLPAQLARSGYVVVVPELPDISTHPSAANHPALAAMSNVLAWLRQTWEHRQVLMPATATAAAGHSYGALLAARVVRDNNLAAFAGLSGVWQDWPSGPLPIEGLNRPKLFVWGGPEDLFTPLSNARWTALPAPKHRAIFASGYHWDYLPAGQTPCDPNRGPCQQLGAAAMDLVTMFFARYLPPELSPHLPGRIPDNLVPPPLPLTPEQQFFAGGHLVGMKSIKDKPACAVSLTFVTGNERAVPNVRHLPRATAEQTVIAAGLQPVFTGAGGSGTWVFSQSPQPGTLLPPGGPVTMVLRSGEIP
jgi:dienelactone hydrolase